MSSLPYSIGGDSDLNRPEVRQPLLPGSTEKAVFPEAPWTRALVLKDGSRMPQTIAHRGYKAKFPENTMAAFKGAADVGAHALETDIHLSRDGVVVLSHDPTLKRCFGMPDKLVDCDWEHLSTLRTLAEPHVPMPRLQDLLEYVAQPGLEHLWVLLDIKLDNDADQVMRLIAQTIQQVKPATGRPWNDRVVLGCWAAKYVPLCKEYLPGFPISYIGFTTSYARKFFAVPNVSFNMLQAVLMGPIGAAFLRKAKKLNRPVFTWTVNDENRMRWSIKKQLDGVITDDPAKFLKVCEDWDEQETKVSLGFHDWIAVFKLQFLVLVFSNYFRWKFGMWMDGKYLMAATRGLRN